MEQNGIITFDLFEKLKSSYDLAPIEQKKMILDHLNDWIKAQIEVIGDQKDDDLSRFELEMQEDPFKDKSGESRLDRSNPSVVADLSRILENEFILQQITENIEQVFWLSDFHSERIIYISPGFQSIWGRTRESLYTNPKLLIESVHPEDRVQVMVTRSHKNPKPLNQAYRILHPDGSVRWVYARSFLIRDNSGETDYLFSIAEDITDQKRVEQTLRKTLDRIHEQFNLSHRMSLARKPEVVLKTLMSAFELRQAQRASLLYFNQLTLGPASGLEVVASWQSNRNLKPWSGEINLYEEPSLADLLQPNRPVVIRGIESDPHLDPKLRNFLLEGKIKTLVTFPLVSLGDWVGCLLVYYQNETQLNQIELRQLKVLVDQAAITLYNLRLLDAEEELRHQAERVNEIKTEFLAIISHELRTPLTSIIGFTTTMLAEDVHWEPAEQRDFIQTIQLEAGRLNELIDHLLDLSRLEAKMLPISLEPISLNKIIEDALPQFNSLTNKHTLTIKLPGNLPLINADPKRISQVLVNLVGNSAKYSPKGTEINISASVIKGFLKVNVSDQGPGIHPTEHSRVFKAFERGKNGENGFVQGAGLGLAICKGLVDEHGGRIWIKKKTTLGATISFTIPLMPLQITAEPAVEE